MPEDMNVLIGRIDERTALMKEKLDNHVTTVNKLLQRHDVRIRALETRLSWVLGVGAGSGAIAGLVATVIIMVFGG